MTADIADANSPEEQTLSTPLACSAEPLYPSNAMTTIVRRLYMSHMAARTRAMIDIGRHCRAMAEIEETLLSIRP